MSSDSRVSLVLTLSSAVMLGLAGVFHEDWVGPFEGPPAVPLVDEAFTNTATVRLSAAQVIAAGGDTSGLECYACHDRAKPVKIKMDDQNGIVLPEEHEDLVMRHGRNRRNDYCYNCHDPENLDSFKTRDGRQLKWAQTTELCASCHGPTYRDWEVGIHGRLSGFWDRSKGPRERQECASCHHPHAPAFPSIKPAPGPHLLHGRKGFKREEQQAGEVGGGKGKAEEH